MFRKTKLLIVYISLIINLSAFSQSFNWSMQWSKEIIKTEDNRKEEELSKLIEKLNLKGEYEVVGKTKTIKGYIN